MAPRGAIRAFGRGAFGPLRSLVYTVAARAVPDVYIDGHKVVEYGRALTLDRADDAGRLAEAQARMLSATPRHDYKGRGAEAISPLSLPVMGVTDNFAYPCYAFFALVMGNPSANSRNSSVFSKRQSHAVQPIRNRNREASDDALQIREPYPLVNLNWRLKPYVLRQIPVSTGRPC